MSLPIRKPLSRKFNIIFFVKLAGLLTCVPSLTFPPYPGQWYFEEMIAIRNKRT